MTKSKMDSMQIDETERSIY